MPKVNLKYLAPICDIAGTYHDQATVSEGATLAHLADQLSARYGTALRNLFFESRTGEFRPQFIILVNGQAASDFSWPLQDGDSITFIPPVAGG